MFLPFKLQTQAETLASQKDKVNWAIFYKTFLKWGSFNTAWIPTSEKNSYLFFLPLPQYV